MTAKRGSLSTESTLGAYEVARRRFDALEGVHVLRIDVATLQRWVDSLEDGGLAPSTIRQTVLLLRQAWGHGRVRGWVPARDLPQVRFPKPRRVNNRHTPTYADIASAREALSQPWHRVLLDVLTETGARPGEVAAWRWENCQDGDRVLLDGKTGPRWVPMTARLRAALDGWSTEQGEPSRGPVWPSASRPGLRLNSALRRVCPLAGVATFSCYGLRRRVASTLIARIGIGGFGVHTYEAWMGHSYAVGRRIYAEVNPERLGNAAAVLDEAQGVLSLDAARKRRQQS